MGTEWCRRDDSILASKDVARAEFDLDLSSTCPCRLFLAYFI